MVAQIPGAAPAMAGLVGAARHAVDEERVVLRDGSVAVIRPLAAGDVAAIAAWFEGLGEETRYARFLVGVNTLDDRTRSKLAQVDHWDHEALTAVAADGAIAGISRYIRLPEPETAEVAVAVLDRWRGRGIASLLLQRIAVRAYAAGICRLTAVCLRSNTVILRLLGRLGPMTITPATLDLVEVRIGLPPAAQSAAVEVGRNALWLPHSLLRGLRAAAEAVGGAPPGRVVVLVDGCLAFLTQHLIPHAKAEEAALYPAVPKVPGTPQGTATMSQEHEEVGRLTAELQDLRGRLAPGEADSSLAADLRRVLDGLYTLVEVHFPKEEEAYLPLLEEHLPADEAESC